jgi:murein DD-endopeptidase MepM/ murein hydrolase activator NlpD
MLLLRASRDRARSSSIDRQQPARPLPAAPPAAPPPSAAPAPPPAARPQFARPGVGPLTSRFGSRWGRLHAGIDLASGTGAPVSAAAEGTVLSAATEGGYGQVVRVQHADDTVTVYAHLSALLVRPGQRVPAGTVLGREGSTGHSTGPHLHFEVRIAGVPVDPLPWLRARGVDPAA